ncbi:MAG: ABC transporter permease subunit [Clostridiales bacterium]|jgi:putative aldouronate transport system permease protein|nr:ABC transporter permease subunit [Clostridiales bacterium]
MAMVKKALKRYHWQYIMVMFGIACLILFSYAPMLGLQIAFRDFRIGRSMWTSKWVGLSNFKFLQDSEFWRVMKNTITLTMSRLVISFPAPIILALLLNEIRNSTFKQIVQSITYIPHFISWVVIAYMLDSLLSPYSGLVNEIIKSFGGSPVFFMGSPKWFTPLFVIASTWKEVGWGTIVYLAAISGIELEMYEAARLDGAGRWKQMLYITLPCLAPTISLLFILSLPGILNAGIDAVYPLMNSANLEVSTVLDVYVLQNGLERGKYSFSTAVGLVSSVFSLILVWGCNKLSNKILGDGLW